MIKIGVYSPDVASNKGVCGESLGESLAISEILGEDSVYLVSGKAYGEEKNNTKVLSIAGRPSLSFLKKYVDIVHMRGMLSFSLFNLCKKLVDAGIPVVVSPYSHVTKYNLTHKIFFEDPDVSVLTSATKNYSLRVYRKLLHKSKIILSPIGKTFILMLWFLFLARKVKGWIFFSEYERDEFLRIARYFGVKEEDIVYDIIPEALWSDGRVKEALSEPRKNIDGGFIRIVFWGRLDWYTKGIDRMLRWIVESSGEVRRNKIRFYFMGPSYAGGQSKIEDYIVDNSIDDIVLISPQKEWKGTLRPLRDAHYSLLLSKWDGFPRALRESIALGVPVIVSTETNFADVVKRFGCGFVVDLLDDFRALMSRLPSIDREKLSSMCMDAANYINPDVVADRFVSFCCKCVK